jgi:hypothetical protein
MKLKLHFLLPVILVGGLVFWGATPVFAHDHIISIPSGEYSSMELETTVSGTITDGDGIPMIGVSVLEKGTGNGTISDVSGKYRLTVNDGATLVFSYISYTSQEISISGRTTIDVVMAESTSVLNEVVVIGYGRQAKRDITGSVSTLSADQIKDFPVTSFENAIQGQLAGVQVTETSGEPGAGPSIRVRGLGSISAGNEPLYVIDGLPISKMLISVFKEITSDVGQEGSDLLAKIRLGH